MDLSQEKGASTWLMVLPVKEYGFSLHKGAFRDAFTLRYGWNLNNSPSTCSCGSNFSVEHVLSCIITKGGYPSIRHNEILDLTAHLMTEVMSQRGFRATPPATAGERFSGTTARIQDGARLDVAANGFWEADSRGH